MNRYRFSRLGSSMHFDKKAFIQRAILAFTTGLFLACSAHLAAQPGVWH